MVAVFGIEISQSRLSEHGGAVEKKMVPKWEKEVL
jgi:hypothetical protein